MFNGNPEKVGEIKTFWIAYVDINKAAIGISGGNKVPHNGLW